MYELVEKQSKYGNVDYIITIMRNLEVDNDANKTIRYDYEIRKNREELQNYFEYAFNIGKIKEHWPFLVKYQKDIANRTFVYYHEPELNIQKYNMLSFVVWEIADNLEFDVGMKK